MIGIFAALLNGLTHPIGSIFIAYVYIAEVEMYTKGTLTFWKFYRYLDDKFDYVIQILFGMLGFAFYVFIPNFIQFTLMAKIEEEIVEKLRVDVFRKLMVMPSQWYEKSENEGGQGASRLGSETQKIGALVTKYIPNLINNFTSMLVGIGVSIYFCWKIGLLSIFLLPAITFAGYLSISLIGGFDDNN